ncbi:hypothetical protein PF011_g6217 [Phytophthora fragariae]|uniref:Uncharacterized protein n=1 Tax=Phytophthora fragariae TaxID=53985 RepID=A0A6A3LGQ1_9STRA|nr:hypothetical protein PF011_g6217 [Phytophthora fragariae]
MTNAASRLKAKNTKNATANAEAKPSSATKVQATKVTAAPARAITSAGSFKPTNTNVNAADSMNAAKASTAKPFALSDVTTWSVQHSVGASLVLRLVLGLAPEKRAACQTLREILNLDNAARLVLVPTTKGLKPISSKTNAADWTKVNQYKLKHMVKQAQSDKFQDTMQQLGGQHLYDSIRTQLKQVDGVWDASKDRPGLQAKSLRSLLNSTKSSKQQKEAEHRKQQPAKNATKGQIQAVKILEVTKVPPPAPTSLKLTKVTSPVKKAQAKNIGPAKNPTQTKNATPIKGVPLLGSWAGPVPASVVLSRPGAIVSSVPTVSARAGNGGRAILSRAI